MHAEVTHDKMAQDSVAFMATVGLSQVISGLMHQGVHMLDMVFCLDQDAGDLKQEM